MNVDDDAKNFLEKYIDAIFKEHEDFEDIFRNILCGQGIEPNLETILSYIIGNVIGFLDGFYLSKHNRTMNVNERKELIDFLKSRAFQLRQAFASTRVKT